MPSRTSTSAARPWSARAEEPRQRAGGVGIVTDPADYGRSSPSSRPTPARSPTKPASIWPEGLRTTPPATIRIANHLTALADDGGTEGLSGAFQSPSTRCRICVTARTPTRAPRSTKEPTPAGAIAATQVQGKELSYNNIADADAAWECVKAFEAEFDSVACVIVKHANPCGVAIAASPLEAYKRPFHRSHLGFRRHHRLQPPWIDGRRRSRQRPVRRSASSPRHTDEALGAVKAKQNVRVLIVPVGAVRQPDYSAWAAACWCKRRPP